MHASFARTLLPFCLAISVGSHAEAQSLQVSGQAGVLGEWELNASVTGDKKEFSGPLTLRHTGFCTQDGPEEKSGQIQFQLSPSRLKATLLINGVTCSYQGRKTDAYQGTLSCPGKRDEPLLLWVRSAQ
jgi:hypothetical protein